MLKNVALEDLNKATPDWIHNINQWKQKLESNVNYIVSFVKVSIIFRFIGDLLHIALTIMRNLFLTKLLYILSQ